MYFCSSVIPSFSLPLNVLYSIVTASQHVTGAIEWGCLKHSNFAREIGEANSELPFEIVDILHIAPEVELVTAANDFKTPRQLVSYWFSRQEIGRIFPVEHPQLFVYRGYGPVVPWHKPQPRRRSYRSRPVDDLTFASFFGAAQLFPTTPDEIVDKHGRAGTPAY